MAITHVKGIVVQFEDGQYGIRKRGIFFVGYLPFKSLYKYRDLRYDKDSDTSVRWKKLEECYGRYHKDNRISKIRGMMEKPVKPKRDCGTILRAKDIPING